MEYDYRSDLIMTRSGFRCTCALCEAEGSDSPALRQRRWELKAEAELFLAANPGGTDIRLQKPTNGQFEEADRLARAIKQTYDVAKYKCLLRTVS